MGEIWGFHRPAGDVGCSAVPLSLHSEGRPVRLRKDGLPTVHRSDIQFYPMQKTAVLPNASGAAPPPKPFIF